MSPGKRTGRKRAAPVSGEDRLADAVARCREKMERGETVDVDAMVRGRGASADALRERLRAILQLDDALGSALTHDGGAPVPVGTELGPYRLLRVLGAGGMGTVYLASVETESSSGARGEHLALKVVHPHLIARRGYLERFRREAELGMLVRHPNVVRTLGSGETRRGRTRCAWLAMEFVEGRTLAELMREHGPSPEPLCRHVGHEIAAALEAIHAAGAVHRDVKPDNVLVSAGDVIKLMDLGVARPQFDAATLSQTGAFVGSMLYAAPEQFGRRTGEVDARTDLHAVGLLLYEMATGVHPYAADSPVDVVRRIHDERPRPIGDVVPSLSPFFEELVATLLAKDPRDRLASASELRATLEQGEASEFWTRRAAGARRTSHRLIRRPRAPGEPPCVGRETEIQVLRASFARAAKGDGGTVLVTGEAGIGKSRLADELADRLGAGRVEFDVLFVGHAPLGGGDAFLEALRTHLRGATGDDDLRELMPSTPRLVAGFGALLRGEPPPAGAPPLTPDSLQALFIQAVRGLASRRPVLVWVDDLHFAPTEARALFWALARGVAGQRVLLVGTTRPVTDAGFSAELARRGDVARIDLARLGVKDLVLLLREVLGSTALAEELAGRVGLKSDGNPYFALEIVRTLMEEGHLARKPDGRWRTTQTFAEIKVPSSIQDLVAMRLSGLAREDRDLLDAAACVGFRFDPTLVGDALGLPRIPALRRFAAIEKACRIVRSEGRDYAFDHHQAQEVIHGAIHDMLREEYHAAIGAAIESRAGAADRPPAELDGELCIELTRHFVAGGQGRRALRYLDPALNCLERTTRFDALGRLVRSLLAVPGLVEGEARCRMLLRNPHHLGRGLVIAERRKQVEEAIALADATGDLKLRGGARNILAVLSERYSDYAHAEAVFVEALAMARECGDLVTEMGALSNLGIVLHRTGRLPEARERYVEARVVAQKIGRRDLVATCDSNLAQVEMTIGSRERAYEHCKAFLAAAREIGEPRLQVPGLGNLGNLESDLGRLGVAVALQREGLALARESGMRNSEAITLLNLGNVLDMLGEQEEASDSFEVALARTREIDYPHLEAALLHRLGVVAADRGDDVAARERLEDAVRLASASGFRAPHEADGKCVQAAIAERAGRLDEARAGFEEAVAVAHAEKNASVLVTALAGLARLSARGPEEVRRAFEEGATKMSWHARMRGHFQVWEACSDAAHLAEAKRLLDHLVEHAPADHREPMLTRVALHRRITEAAAATA